ncbi:MAG: hypothetical protein EA425_11090 [Puniceicoccaceae bacterium]|nr:MAG: hypothetical protein EA425_11090 [Puniceicoccaceae bacterium]
MGTSEILLGSILLERNRWRRTETPLCRPVAWAARAREAGFDGWELWEDHYHRADAEDRERLLHGRPPVRVFNTYAPFENPGAPQLDRLVAAVRELRPRGVKFNVGKPPGNPAALRATLDKVLPELPGNCRLWCECHGGTWLETPGAVTEFLAGYPDPPFDLIFHPFALPEASVTVWMEQHGPRLVHAHVQRRGPGDQWESIAAHPDETRTRLALLRRLGYRGSFTLEFTAGTATPEENEESLFAAALADLRLLRNVVAAS